MFYINYVSFEAAVADVHRMLESTERDINTNIFMPVA